MKTSEEIMNRIEEVQHLITQLKAEYSYASGYFKTESLTALNRSAFMCSKPFFCIDTGRYYYHSVETSKLYLLGYGKIPNSVYGTVTEINEEYFQLEIKIFNETINFAVYFDKINFKA